MMKHYIGILDTRFECDADNEKDAQKILRLLLLAYVQTNEKPLVILEEPKSSGGSVITLERDGLPE